ncbi:MAG: hypothetical protein K6G00_09395 [Treponema sp.]|nr:hypothetical protein [Treponema sp.]
MLLYSFFTEKLCLYRYAGNNPVRYVDPTGAFDVDCETKVINTSLDDKLDMVRAERVFLALQDDGYFCKAKDSNSEQSITFTNARGMDAFINGTYEQYLNEVDFVFDEFFLDIVGLITSDAPQKSFSGVLNIGLTTYSVMSDLINAADQFSSGNMLSGINYSADMIIDAIGYGGIAGACVSVELKYTKRGLLFTIEQLAKAEIELEHYVINYFTKSVSGVTIK